MRIKAFFKANPMFPVVILFTLLVSGTSVYLKQYWIAVVELILGVVLGVIVYAAERKTFRDLIKSVELLNLHLDENTRDDISTIPFPLVICTKTGGIEWYNELFKKDIVGNTELTKKQIYSLIPEKQLENSAEKGSFNAAYDGKRYTVFVSQLTKSSEKMYVLYFVDDTYYKNIAEKYEDTRPVVMIASVDGMEEVSSRISQNAFSTLLSDVERMIISWFTHYRCVLRKVGDGRFFIVAEKKIFEQMKDKNFNILDMVRDHKLEGINAGFTLSIGIATGNEFIACEELARKSVDMAKGRGGDQVVINDNNNYEFFGGVATGVENRNQVQARIYASAFEELVRHSSRVLVMGHKNADLDAIGSAIGVYEAVKALDIDVKIVVDEKTSMAEGLIEQYRQSANEDCFISPSGVLSELDDETLVVVTDVMRPGFTEAPELVEMAHKKVVIDHHRMSIDYMSDALLLFHEPNSSSASEMVTELIRYMPSKPAISKEAAEALLSGIYLDTKNFTLRTGVRTFEAAASLRDYGADTITVRKLFAASVDENLLVSRIVNEAEIRGNFAFAKTSINDSSVRLVAAKAADELLNIENVDASFVIFPVNENDYSISARSYGRVNVQVLMEKLGGGGHQTMAAAQIKNTTMRQVEDSLGNIIFDYCNRKSAQKNN